MAKESHDQSATKAVKKKRDRISRRGFLAASTSAVVAPLILPQGVLARAGRPGANDRIITGHIGVGGMGRGHLNAMKDQVGVVADVDKNHQDMAKKIVGRDIETFTDYRYILDRNDIDAIVCAAPDHWHGIITVDACQAGKDVYCEKPACKTIEDGQKMVEAARRYGRVVQIGSQGRSNPNAYDACTYLRNNQIGKVSTVDIWHENNWTTDTEGGYMDPPDTLDWDMWLGPSRYRPYHPEYVHFNFRWIMDWGGGFVRDRGAHVMSLVHWFLEHDYIAPKRVTATGTPYKKSIWDVPESFEVTWEYDDLTVNWRQPGEAQWDHSFGAIYRGENGTLIVPGGDGWTDVEQKAKDYKPGAGDVVPFRSDDHRGNWLECIRTRERPIMDVEVGVRVANCCIMSMISYRVGRTLEWDDENQRFINDDEANRYLSNPGRGQWHI